MWSYLQNHKTLILLCLFTGLTALVFLPVTPLDRLPIPRQTSVLANKNILSFELRESYTPPRYLICNIDDDPEGYNNYGIYHPQELAVTVKNLKRLGIKHLFLGTHLHWPDLDQAENGTLNTAISELDSCIISIPLRRTAGALEIPNYLLATSVAADSVKGDLSLVPKVNNLSLPPSFIIPKNTQAGFSQLETEKITRKIPLLAQWGKRIILSSLLLERLHHLNIKHRDLEIFLGKHIILGKSGNIIPIDEFGYFSPTVYPAEAKPDIISGEITDFDQSPIVTTNAILTASGLKADNYRAINQPVTQLNQLTLTPVFSKEKICKPAHFIIQFITLLIVIYLLISMQSIKGRKKLLWIALLILFWLTLAIIVARASSYYLVITHLVVAILTLSLYRFIIDKRNEILADSNQGVIDFDEISNSFKKIKIARKDTKKASKRRKRDRRKIARQKRVAKKKSN